MHVSQGHANVPLPGDPLAFFTVRFAVKYVLIRRGKDYHAMVFWGPTCVRLKHVDSPIFVSSERTTDTGRFTKRVRSARPVKRAPVHVTFNNFLIIFD